MRNIKNRIEVKVGNAFVNKKSLKGWKVKQMESKKIDYYQYLTYKIENGKIVEVLP